jgi:hypothetical protein
MTNSTSMTSVQKLKTGRRIAEIGYYRDQAGPPPYLSSPI